MRLLKDSGRVVPFILLFSSAIKASSFGDNILEAP